MKRKRTTDQADDQQTCDLVLTDANGRSIRVHKALLIDKSDYFARILSENNLNELQLNENYLIDLIRYLYNHEGEDQHHPQQVSPSLSQSTGNTRYSMEDSSRASFEISSVLNEDLIILMQLLALSKKYEFRQLYPNLMTEINYKLGPSSILIVYRCARELDIEELQRSTRIMILSWLPQLQKTCTFFSLSEDSINDIFSAESPEIDSECKLNALSAWWSHNKEADMTNLWVKLITCNSK